MNRALAAQQTGAEQAAMAARRIGGASPVRELVFAAVHTSQTCICAGRFGCCQRVEIRRFFAPGLIAAKPVKPCDRGVLGTFYLLPKKEQIAPLQPFPGPCFLHLLRPQPDFDWAAARPFMPGCAGRLGRLALRLKGCQPHGRLQGVFRSWFDSIQARQTVR